MTATTRPGPSPTPAALDRLNPHTVALETPTMHTRTTPTAPASPLAALAAAEAQLLGAIDEATARLDEVATGSVEKALARLQEASEQAIARIAAAKARLDALAAGVLASLEGTAAAITAQIAATPAGATPPAEAPSGHLAGSTSPSEEHAPAAAVTVAANAPVEAPAPAGKPDEGTGTRKPAARGRKPRGKVRCPHCGARFELEARAVEMTCPACGRTTPLA